MQTKPPVLYSFRRCPYAIRVRLAIAYAAIDVEIREVALKNKPTQLLALSPKATVPVLQLEGGVVIDESLDIMRWALAYNDPERWLALDGAGEQLIAWNDGAFKYFLDRYKYADRYPEFSAHHYRRQAEAFLIALENHLRCFRYLCGNDFSLADAAIFPFVRQFAGVDNDWFHSSNYQRLKQWLETLLNTELFRTVMVKYPVWVAGDSPIIMP
ncbi:MAG: glutathione S-transferase [Methylovulum sp.]|nr:glutathione S-transferase [Methylovulum sp.]